MSSFLANNIDISRLQKKYYKQKHLAFPNSILFSRQVEKTREYSINGVSDSLSVLLAFQGFSGSSSAVISCDFVDSLCRSATTISRLCKIAAMKRKIEHMPNMTVIGKAFTL